ncbi:MAG: C25 family cysteine peptidase, partial [candidate division WOR-3 bacterium]
MNAGVAFCHPAGHGNEQGIYSENGTPLYTSAQAISQTNGLNRLCVMNSMACDPGNFEYSDCVAELLLTNPNGGAVGVMMNSRYGWGTPPMMGPSERLDVEFYNCYFSSESTDLGVIHARGLDNFRAEA